MIGYEVNSASMGPSNLPSFTITNIMYGLLEEARQRDEHPLVLPFTFSKAWATILAELPWNLLLHGSNTEQHWS